MERLSNSAPDTFKSYLTLTKPGILMGNGINALGGFLLASKGQINPLLFLLMFLGLTGVMAAGCVINNCIDKDLDSKMQRTQSRALVQGTINIKQALLFASILGALGLFVLAKYVNLLSFYLGLFGLVVYILFYSYSKYYSSYGTLIGSFAGAVPPVIGYCAVTHAFDLGASLLFLILICWQMPHFYAIALYRLEDYRLGDIPTTPLKKGLRATQIQMLLYVLGFMFSVSLLTHFGLTNRLFLIGMLGFSLYWLYLSIKGFFEKDSVAWGRRMFLFSLMIIMVFSLLIPFCVNA